MTTSIMSLSDSSLNVPLFGPDHGSVLFLLTAVGVAILDID